MPAPWSPRSPRGASTVAPATQAAGSQPAPRPRPDARARPADDALAAPLARAVARRRAQPLLQRAIIAIDGDNDNAVALASTRSCLVNLQRKPGRDAVAGPDVLANLRSGPALRAPDETIYVLGHGSRRGTVAGLTPEAMGLRMRDWYAGQRYTGAIRLVACHSAWTGTEHLPDGGRIVAARSYADRLASWFGENPSRTFRPSSVQGLLGIGWVRPDTGKQLSIDTPTYRALSAQDKATFTTGGTQGFNTVAGALGAAVQTGAAAKVKYDVPYTFLGNTWGALKGAIKDVTGAL